LISGIHQSDGTFEVVTSRIPGTSGTPVFDNNENVLGLLGYEVDATNDYTGSAVDKKTYLIFSLEHASVLAKQVISKTKPKCGWLGVCIDLTSSCTDGIMITNVIKGSPADLSNLKAKDKIYEFNGLPVSNVRDFSEAFMKSKAGETVSIKVLRGDERIAVNVKLTGR